MKVTTTPVEMWSTDIEDQAGGLARTLRALAEFGVDLDYVVARRQHGSPGRGVVFVTASNRRIQLDRTTDMGLRRVADRPMLRIEGHDEPGAGAKLSRAIAEAGVNVKRFAASAIGHRYVCYVEFDSAEDCAKADAALKRLNSHPAWAFWSRDAAAA